VSSRLSEPLTQEVIRLSLEVFRQKFALCGAATIVVFFSANVSQMLADQADKPDSDPVYHRLTEEATALYHQGKYREGLIAIERAVRLHPGGASGRVVKGLLLSAEHRYDEADKVLRSVIADDPKAVDAHLWLSHNLLAQERPEESLKEMQIFAAQKGIDACFDHLAALLIMTNRTDDAIALCNEYLKRHPGRASSAIQLKAVALAQSGKWEPALGLLDSIAKEKEKSGGFHEIRAYCLAQTNRAHEAKEELQLALAAEPAVARALITNRTKGLRYTKEAFGSAGLRAALTKASSVLAIYESVYSVPLSAQEKRQEELRKRIESSNPKLEIETIERKVSRKTAEPDDFRVLAKLLWKANRPSSAIAAYDKLIKACPADFDAFFERGRIYFELLMDEEAIRDLSCAIELRPESKDAYRMRALCHKRLGHVAEARADLTRAFLK
jgi:tetratricopeptide (TPR) repeat protein